MTSREADIVERLGPQPYSKCTPEHRAESLKSLMDPDSGWPSDWKDGLGKRVDGSMVWHANAADIMLLIFEIERLSQENEGLRTAQKTNAKLANALMEMAARLSVNSPLGWCRPDCVALQEAARILRGEPEPKTPDIVGAVLSAVAPVPVQTEK
jgi:hypothetical protein